MNCKHCRSFLRFTFEEARVRDEAIGRVVSSAREHHRVELFKDGVLSEPEVAVRVQGADVCSDLHRKAVRHDGAVVQECDL